MMNVRCGTIGVVLLFVLSLGWVQEVWAAFQFDEKGQELLEKSGGRFVPVSYSESWIVPIDIGLKKEFINLAENNWVVIRSSSEQFIMSHAMKFMQKKTGKSHFLPLGVSPKANAAVLSLCTIYPVIEHRHGLSLFHRETVEMFFDELINILDNSANLAKAKRYRALQEKLNDMWNAGREFGLKIAGASDASLYSLDPYKRQTRGIKRNYRFEEDHDDLVLNQKSVKREDDNEMEPSAQRHKITVSESSEGSSPLFEQIHREFSSLDDEQIRQAYYILHEQFLAAALSFLQGKEGR